MKYEIDNEGYSLGVIDEQTGRKVSIERFYGLSEQEILVELARDAVHDSGAITETLLILVELGIIDVNMPMRQGVDSSHYTPLFAAIVLDNDISGEQIQRFLDAGAYLQHPWRWSYPIPRLNKLEAAITLIEQASFGSDMNERLIRGAFSWGNDELFNYLTDDVSPALLDAKLSADLNRQAHEGYESLMRTYQTAESNGMLENPRFVQSMQAHLGRRQGQVIMLLNSSYLTLTEREKLEGILQHLDEFGQQHFDP